jgi:hypothetical protein
MVAPERVSDAEQLLLAGGYRCPDGDRVFRRAFLAGQRQYTFVRESDALVVDLHWGFSGRHVPFPLATASAWSDLRRLAMGDHEVATLSQANLALVLAGHGTKEGWRLLKWISDFARLVGRAPALDWLEVHRRAHRQGSGDAILLACAMAAQVLDVPVPRALAALVTQNGHVRSAARALADRLRLSTHGEPSHFADLALCDDGLGRIRAGLGLAFTPTSGDYRALPLPPPLWPAYYLTRPFRLAAQALAGAIGRRRGD